MKYNPNYVASKIDAFFSLESIMQGEGFFDENLQLREAFDIVEGAIDFLIIKLELYQSPERE